jgi:tetratricopeptide (TPR) repeat protein
MPLTSNDEVNRGRATAISALVLALAVIELLILHGSIWNYPFLADDYIFLTEAKRGLWPSLTHAFLEVPQYFRPVSRELYFWSVLHLPVATAPVFRIVNLGILVATLAMIAWIGRRLGSTRAGLLAAGLYALFYGHRVLLAYVNCAQDLLAAAIACAAVAALLAGRRVLAGGAFLFAVFSKESVVLLPFALTAWLAWPEGSRRNVRWREALRATLPCWIALGVLAITTVLRMQLAHASIRGSTAPASGCPFSIEAALSGARTSQLAIIGLEQPWSMLRLEDSPWIPAALVAAALGVAPFALARGREGGRRAIGLGLLWMLVGLVPPVLLGTRFNAYYVMFPAIGAAIVLGSLLARAPALAGPATFALGAVVGLAANGVTAFRESPEDRSTAAGISMVSAARMKREVAYADSLRSTLLADPPPRGAAVYLSQPFGFLAMGTSAALAPRLWLDDPGLDIHWMRYAYMPAEGRPRAFLRYNPGDGSFVRLPDSLVTASIRAAEAQDAGRLADARRAFEHGLAYARPGIDDHERGGMQSALGILCFQLGDTAAARMHWLATIDTELGRRRALFGLAALDEQVDRYEGARAWIARALEAFPNDPDALYDLAIFDRILGDSVSSDALWRRLVANHPQYADSKRRDYEAARSP